MFNKRKAQNVFGARSQSKKAKKNAEKKEKKPKKLLAKWITTNNKRVTSIDGSSIVWCQRRQLPCAKGGSWSAKLADGRLVFVKELPKESGSLFQVALDNIKHRFGIVPLGIKWEEPGLLWCKDLGTNDSTTNIFPAEFNPLRPEVPLIRGTLKAGMPISKIKDTDDIDAFFNPQRCKDILTIAAFRFGVFMVSDSTTRNLLAVTIDGTTQVVSVDEMTETKKEAAKQTTDLPQNPKDVLTMMFSRVPNEKQALKLKEWLATDRNAQTLADTIHTWKQPLAETNTESMFADASATKREQRRQHMENQLRTY
jgi:hypothetical protein